MGFYSASGGVGRSSVIIGLAWLLSCPRLSELRKLFWNHEDPFNIGVVDFDFEAPSLIYYADIDKIGIDKLAKLNTELSADTWNIRSFFTLMFWGMEPSDNDIIPLRIGCDSYSIPSLLTPFDTDVIVHIHYTWGSSLRRRAFLSDQMKQVIQYFSKKENLDLVLGDLRNGLGLVTQDVLSVSDAIVAVTRPDPLSINRLRDSILLILNALQSRSIEYFNILMKYVNWFGVITHIDPTYHNDTIQYFIRKIGGNIFNIPSDTTLIESEQLHTLPTLPTTSFIPWVKRLGGKSSDKSASATYYLDYLNTLTKNINNIIKIIEYVYTISIHEKDLSYKDKPRLLRVDDVKVAVREVMGDLDRDSLMEVVSDVLFVNGLAVLADAILRDAGLVQ